MTSQPRRNDDLTTVTTVSMLQEADVICSVLRSAGINAIVLGGNTASALSYMSFAINPNGIQVAVRPEDAQAARDILEAQCSHQPLVDEPEPVPAPAAGDVQRSPDDCALKAVWSALFAWWFPLFLIAVVYWLVRAHHARQFVPVENLSRYRRRIAWAVFIGIVLPLAILVCLFDGNDLRISCLPHKPV